MNMSVDLTALTPELASKQAAPTARLLSRKDLLALDNAWEELVENALEENAYLCRQYVEALLTHIEHRKVQAISVWRGETLIALLPFTQSRWHWGGIATINKAWTTPYSMLSIPLIDKRDADAAMICLIKAMGDRSTGSNIWLLNEVTIDGPVSKHLTTECKHHNNPTTVLDVFDRATLNREGTFEQHMKEQVSKKRRKDLVRNRKRLGELGTLSLTNCREGAELDHAVNEFLRIEAAGWKGERGTALDCTDATRDFAKQAFGVHNGSTVTRADMLELDGVAIAVNLSLQTGRTAFTIKCAFDEAYRTYSAGLLLEEDMIREFLEGDWADQLDSATAPGHLIQGLWNGSTQVGAILLAVGQTPLPFSFYEMLEHYRRKARTFAKDIVVKLRG